MYIELKRDFKQLLDKRAIDVFAAIIGILVGGIATFVPWFPLTIGLGLLLIGIVVILAPIRSGLLSLWFVMADPAPCDIGFITGMITPQNWRLWLKRWTDVEVSIAVFALVNAFQMMVCFAKLTDWNAVFYGCVTVYLAVLAIFISRVVRARYSNTLIVSTYYITGVRVAAAINLAIAVALVLGVPLGFLDRVGEIIPGTARFRQYASEIGGGFYGVTFDHRVRGFFKDPNVAGPFIVSYLLYMLAEGIYNGWTGKKIVELMLISVAMIVTFSRGAIINLGVGLVVLVVCWLVRGRIGIKRIVSRGLLMFSLLLFVLILALCLSEHFSQERFLSLLNVYDYGRLQAFQMGMREWILYPFGMGPGRSSEIFETMGLVQHSTIVTITLENGILGIFSYFMIFLVLGKRLRSRIRSIGRYNVLIAWLVCSIVGILVESILVPALHWRHFWILLGMLSGTVTNKGTD